MGQAALMSADGKIQCAQQTHWISPVWSWPNEQVADQRTVQSPYPRVTEKEKQNQKVHTI